MAPLLPVSPLDFGTSTDSFQYHMGHKNCAEVAETGIRVSTSERPVGDDVLN
jgi:hypothetical protein